MVNLDLSFCSLTSDALSLLGDSGFNLQVLSLGKEVFNQENNTFDDSSIVYLQTFQRLRSLNLACTAIKNGGVKVLSELNFPYLAELNLSKRFVTSRQ